jgi:hypothetical protein
MRPFGFPVYCHDCVTGIHIDQWRLARSPLRFIPYGVPSALLAGSPIIPFAPPPRSTFSLMPARLILEAAMPMARPQGWAAGASSGSGALCLRWRARHLIRFGILIDMYGIGQD